MLALEPVPEHSPPAAVLPAGQALELLLLPVLLRSRSRALAVQAPD
jgi:hypothetical protein